MRYPSNTRTKEKTRQNAYVLSINRGSWRLIL
jgi:hypothetical protein